MSLLPTNKSKSELNLTTRTIGIFGAAGIGKSTLASFFDSVIFGATEAGLSDLNVSKCIIPTYNNGLPIKSVDESTSIGSFIPFCSAMMTEKHDFKSICIDTYDNLTRICTDWKAAELNVDDISEYKKFGAYHMVTDELHKTIKKLSDSKFGLIMISHVKYVERKTPTDKWEKAVPSVGGKNLDVMVDICDIILFMDIEMRGDKEIGVIKTKPSKYWLAKDKTKLLPEFIEYPLAEPEKAYDVIYQSFKNGGVS